MPYASSLLLLAAVYLAVLASPGPNFFILSQLSLDGRQRDARWTVMGLVTGSVVWVMLSMAGLSALLGSHPLVASAVRLLGAVYLIWYGPRSSGLPGPCPLARSAATWGLLRPRPRPGRPTGWG